MRKFAKLTTVIDREWDLDKIEEVFKAKVFFKNYTNSKGSGFECENKVPEEFRGDSDRETHLFIPNEKVNDFIITTESKKYMIDMFELNHQENGLNEISWKLLPKSCSYIDDKEIVKDLVDRGGLCDNFIRHWINE